MSELKVVKMSEVIPYENNPRKNDDAVEAVKESIKQCGYIAPIIVDENMVILAGHTRYKALKKLGKEEVEVKIQYGMSEEQKKKYRILDNKTSEFAEWDFELLDLELQDLDFDGFDFGFVENSYIDELLDDTFADVNGDLDEFQISFVFPVEKEIEIKKFIKEKSKQYITDMIIREVEGLNA